MTESYRPTAKTFAKHVSRYAMIINKAAAQPAEPGRGRLVTAPAPKPGFDWSRLTWGRPDSPPSVLCSYCSAALPGNEVTLILWDESGQGVRFCYACMETWWDFQPRSFPDGEEDWC